MSGLSQQEKFARSVEADIAVSEAEALASTDPKEARKLYTYARQTAPDDAEVWFASGRFEAAQNNKDKALGHYAEAMRLKPEHPQAGYERAVLLASLKRDAEAKAAFADLATRFPNDHRPAYYLGMYALQSDDNAAARAYFNKGREGDDTLAAYSRSYHAILQAQAGDVEGANFAKAALPTAPTPALRAALEGLAAGASDSGARYLPWFNMRGEVLTEFDTNASLGAARFAQVNENLLAGVDPNDPDAVAQLPLLQGPQAGLRVTEQVRLVFRPVAKEVFTLELEGEFVNANHVTARDTLARYDFGGPTGTARIYSRLGGPGLKVELGLDLTYRDLWTNLYRSHLLRAYGGTPFIGLVFAPRHGLYALGTVEYRDFEDSSVIGDPNNRDGLSTSVGLFYTLPVWLFDFVVNGAYDQDNTNGRNFFMRGGRGSVAARFNWKNTIVAMVFGSANLRAYQIAEPRRFEARYEGGAQFRYYPIPYFGIGLNYTYTHNDAQNLDAAEAFELFTYRRHVAGLSLIGQF